MIVRLMKPTRRNDPWVLLAQGEAEAALVRAPPEIEAIMPDQSAWFEAERVEGGWQIKGRLAGHRRHRAAPRSGSLRREIGVWYD